jgi:hypothetical protein
MKTGVLSIALLAVVAGCQSGDETHDVHWSYSGDAGPEHWGELSPDYAAASSGHAQSPIDISNGEKGTDLFSWVARASVRLPLPPRQPPLTGGISAIVSPSARGVVAFP